jgi:hypothetical protein
VTARYDIFLSYASQDELWASELADRLDNDGYTVFHPATALRPGENWAKTVDDALAESETLVAIVSPAYVRSHVVGRELAHFEASGKTIIPVLIRPMNTDVPAGLRRRRIVDLTGRPRRGSRVNYEPLRDRLAEYRAEGRAETAQAEAGAGAGEGGDGEADVDAVAGIAPGAERDGAGGYPSIAAEGAVTAKPEPEPGSAAATGLGGGLGRPARIAIVHTLEDRELAASIGDGVTTSGPGPAHAWAFEASPRIDGETGGLRPFLVESWRGTRTPAPDSQTPDAVIATADVVLILVRREAVEAWFIGSSMTVGLLERHEAGGVAVIPVITAPVRRLESLPFGHLPALPADGRPVGEWESQDAALANIIDGVRLVREDVADLAVGPTRGGTRGGSRPGLPGPPTFRGGGPRRGGERGRLRGQVPGPAPDLAGPAVAYELNEVFTRNGVPDLTFVKPPDFFRFVMALKAPGRGIVVEGPSGIGKTTLLKKALERAGMAGLRPTLSARRPADRPKIEQLLVAHEGTVAVDDFHRLPADLRGKLLDHLKILADEESDARLIVVGIPGTGASLIELGFDVATRIDVFRLPKVDDQRILEVIGKGEDALNVTFRDRAQIVRAAAGSLLTAQMLCWELAVINGVERTQPIPLQIAGDVSRAEVTVMRDLAGKYDRELGMFARLDGHGQATCIHLLTELGRRPDGVLYLDELREQARADRPELAAGIDGFVGCHPDGLTGAAAAIEQHLHYDPQVRMIVGEDPQLLFYLRRRSAEQLAAIAGKRLPRPRDQVFVSYSHRDRAWLDRLDVHLQPLVRDNGLDVWDDRRIKAGDRWLDEITSALDRAKVAILLVSANFLASEFVSRREIPPLLAAARRGGCRIVPVIVGSCLFHENADLGAYQPINPADRPLASLPEHEVDGYLVKVARTFLNG